MARAQVHGQTTLSGEILHVTANAVLLEIEEGKFWIPKKVCLDSEALEEGSADVVVANWWLEREGIAT